MVELGVTLKIMAHVWVRANEHTCLNEITRTIIAIGSKARCAVPGFSVSRPFPDRGQVEPKMGT